MVLVLSCHSTSNLTQSLVLIYVSDESTVFIEYMTCTLLFHLLYYMHIIIIKESIILSAGEIKKNATFPRFPMNILENMNNTIPESRVFCFFFKSRFHRNLLHVSDDYMYIYVYFWSKMFSWIHWQKNTRIRWPFYPNQSPKLFQMKVSQ